MAENSRIPEELLLARIAQAEQLREFFVQMWRENPQMAARAGNRIQELMSPLAVPHAGHCIPPVPNKGFPRVTPTIACAEPTDR
jgi:hypothetical protein